MIRTDAAFRTAVEGAVSRLEQGTAAELVVVAAQRSGSYRDVALGVGAATGWLCLVALAASPTAFSAAWTAVDVALVFGVTAWVAHRSPWLLAALAPGARLRRQCLDAARAAFLEEGVDRTAGRTGVLVYLSLLERRVVLVADAGVLGNVAEGDLRAVCWGSGRENESVATLAEFVAGLEALGTVLSRGLPAKGANPNERPDAPRVRP